MCTSRPSILLVSALFFEILCTFISLYPDQGEVCKQVYWFRCISDTIINQPLKFVRCLLPHLTPLIPLACKARGKIGKKKGGASPLSLKSLPFSLTRERG